MPAIPALLTFPATTPSQQDLATPSTCFEKVLDHVVIAPAAAEPLYLHIWAGTGAAFAVGTRRDRIPIPEGTSHVVIAQHYPAGCTVRLSTDEAGTTGPAAAKYVTFRWE